MTPANPTTATASPSHRMGPRGPMGDMKKQDRAQAPATRGNQTRKIEPRSILSLTASRLPPLPRFLQQTQPNRVNEVGISGSPTRCPHLERNLPSVISRVHDHVQKHILDPI